MAAVNVQNNEIFLSIDNKIVDTCNFIKVHGPHVCSVCRSCTGTVFEFEDFIFY